jgi:DNA-binding HxlR family transcriptional regulator
MIRRVTASGTRRFGQLRASLVGISPKTLTDRLTALAAVGLVSRTMYAEIPPRAEYALTDRGRAAAPVIDALGAWGRTLD